MADESVKFQVSGAVATITLNSPETRNALTPGMIAEIGDAVASCASPNVRAVLLTGAGGAFCAGANVRDLVATLEESGPDGISQAIRRTGRRPAQPGRVAPAALAQARRRRHQRRGRRRWLQPDPGPPTCA